LRISEEERQERADGLRKREVVPLLRLVLAYAVVIQRRGEKGYRTAKVDGKGAPAVQDKGNIESRKPQDSPDKNGSFSRRHLAAQGWGLSKGDAINSMH
jgi:hypothetical protein